MASFFKKDFIRIDVAKNQLYRSNALKVIAQDDQYADLIGVYVYENGAPVDLEDWQCQGYFIRSNGDTIPLVGQIQNGNLAFVQLEPSCYDYEGQYALAIKLARDNVAETLRIVDGIVTKTKTETIIDPGTILPSVESLLTAIQNAVDSIPPDYSALSNEVVTIKNTIGNGKSPFNYYEAINDDPTSIHGTSYPFSFAVGNVYRIANVGSVAVGLTTRQDSTQQEEITSGTLAPGNYIDFTATKSANVLRVYWSERDSGKVLVYYGDSVNMIPDIPVLKATDAQHTADIGSIMTEQYTHGRRFLRGNPNGIIGYHTSGGNRVCSGMERITALNDFDGCIDSIECINYDGAVSIGTMNIRKTDISIQMLFYDDLEESYTTADLDNNHKPTTTIDISDLQSQNYVFYTGVLYGNAAIRVKFNPKVVEIADALPTGEWYYYDIGNNAFSAGMDGFIPANVTNKIFNNAYPPFSVYRDHKWLFDFNDAIKEMSFPSESYIGSISQFSTVSGTLIMGITKVENNSQHYISSSDPTIQKQSIRVDYTSDDVMEISILRYGLTLVGTVKIDTSLLYDGITLGTSSAADNTDAMYVPGQKFVPMKAYNIFTGRFTSSGTYTSDNDYAMYLVPINAECKKAILYFTTLANSQIGLCDASGVINQFITPSNGYNLVNCEGYSYIVFTASRNAADAMALGLGYVENESIKSIIAAKKIAGDKRGSYKIGAYDVTVSNNGVVYTDETRSINSYPEPNFPNLEVVEESATFTNTANGKVYSNNCLMEICRDGTRYYISTREDGASESYFFPIIWKQKGDEKSLVLDTNSDHPEDATVYQGDEYPDLSGINWLERSNNTLYQQMDSITELSNGELLISLVGYIPDGDNSVFSTVIFTTIENRTVWVPRLVCTNQKYTYSGSNYTVTGYPTKNNSIQVFQTKYDTTRDCILISEYGTGTPKYWKEQGIEKNGNGVIGKVWLSIDGGQRFKKIFDMDEKINGDADDLSDDNWKWCKSYAGRMATHIHCAYYDPINEMVWITNGDAGTTDGRNCLFYIHMYDLFGWVNAQGSYVSPKNLHPTYTDNEALPPFMMYTMTEQGRDVSYVANALSTQVNFQMYTLYATEKALILGNDASRRIMYGIHNTTINRKSYAESPDMFVDMFYELDEANPQTVLSGMCEHFYRRDENSPLLCFYSNVGILGSWDGVNWRNLHATPSGSEKIGFTTHTCKDTDGKIVFVYKGEGTPECHNYKIMNY